MGKAEKTRHQIIEVAGPIFNRNGYAGTSLSELTEALGMTKGALYGNFRNKDEIALEAFEYNFGKISAGIEEALKGHDNSCDKLTAFADFYAEHYRVIARTGGCPLLNGAIDSDDGHPGLKKRVRGKIAYWKSNLIVLVQRGVRRGEIREDADAEGFAELFIALIEGGIMLSKVAGEDSPLQAVVRHIKGLVEAMREK
mgnify:FL=1